MKTKRTDQKRQEEILFSLTLSFYFPICYFGMKSLESTECFAGIKSVLCVGKSFFWVWWDFFVVVVFCFFPWPLPRYVRRVSYSPFPKLLPVFLLCCYRRGEIPLTGDAWGEGRAVTPACGTGKAQYPHVDTRSRS